MFRIHVSSRWAVAVAATALATAAFADDHAGAKDATPNVRLTVVNVVTAQDVKIWIPESIFAKKGDVVQLRLVNKLDQEHGYKIEAFDVEKVVAGESAETVTFTADKAGIFPISCQLHPPHVAGQLVVLE
jgi:nitrosocyanin